MNTPTNTIRRAFEMADSGAFNNISEIRYGLSKEGHENIEAHFSGQTIRRQINAHLELARLKNKRGT